MSKIIIANAVTIIALLLPLIYYIFIQKNISNVKKVILLYVTIVDTWLSDTKNQEKLEKVLNIIKSMRKEYFILYLIPDKIIISWIIKEVKLMKEHLGSTKDIKTVVAASVNSVVLTKIDEFKNELIKKDYQGNTNIVCNDDIRKITEKLKNDTTKAEIIDSLNTGFKKTNTSFSLAFKKIL